jgi:hypothetical protein
MDGELDVTTADNVLNFEFRELGFESELLEDPRIFSRGKTRILFRLDTRDDRLARREDEGSGLWVADMLGYVEKYRGEYKYSPRVYPTYCVAVVPRRVSTNRTHEP